jgi:ATP-dependent Clp protease ATP-binding subunit ClpA
MKDKLNKLDFKIEYDLPVIDYILNIIKDEKDYGARPIIRAIQDEIENKITDMIIDNEYSSGQTFYIEINNDNLCINTDRIIS